MSASSLVEWTKANRNHTTQVHRRRPRPFEAKKNAIEKKPKIPQTAKLLIAPCLNSTTLVLVLGAIAIVAVLTVTTLITLFIYDPKKIGTIKQW
jgi:hypothetical protein